MNMTNDLSTYVVFVDDDALTRKYFFKEFSPQFTVKVFESKDTALPFILNPGYGKEIAVVISDQRMPEGSGTDLFYEMRCECPNVVRIMTSAWSDYEDLVQGVNIGNIFRFIPKPWDQRTMIEHIKKALDTFRHSKLVTEKSIEQRRLMFRTAGYIAHEMRTPLSGIHCAADSLNSVWLKDLIDAYRIARTAKLSIPFIPNSRLALIGDCIEKIAKESADALTVVDMILQNIKSPDFAEAGVQTLSIRSCIENALSRYPFKTGQRAMVHVLPAGNDIDFNFTGINMFVIHVFFNLIHNAIDAISLAGSLEHGRITIKIEPATDAAQIYNKIVFEDNGPGIPKNLRETLLNLFDNSIITKDVETSASNMGLGIAYCARVMQRLGGGISFESPPNQGASFYLYFPILEMVPLFPALQKNTTVTVDT